MTLPKVVSRAQWLVERKELLAKEKAMTRARDALNVQRRMLPMVRIDKPYVFQGPGGPASLLDLFEGRRQLILGHFMFDPRWEEGCPSCSAGADEVSDGLLSTFTRATRPMRPSRAHRSKRSKPIRRKRAGPSPGIRRSAVISTTTSMSPSTKAACRPSTITRPGKSMRGRNRLLFRGRATDRATGNEHVPGRRR